MSDFEILENPFAGYEQSLVPSWLRDKGWVFYTVKQQFSPESWFMLLNGLGKNEYIVFHQNIIKEGDKVVALNGHLFLSPQAVKNLKEYVSKIKSNHTPDPEPTESKRKYRFSDYGNKLRGIGKVLSALGKVSRR